MNKIIVVTGPTGIGKTKLSIALAKHFNGEIINADSMQVYKELNIGTAKIKEPEKEGIKHHLISIRGIEESYNVYEYQKEGRKIIDKIIKSGKTPIVVGGTGLYIKALLYDYQFKEEIKQSDYSELTNEELLSKVKMVNPDVNIDFHNRKRLVRLLNKYENNIIENNNKNKLLYDAIFIGLTTDRKTLYERINNRVDEMIKLGLLEEVKELYNKKVRNRVIETAIGYKELYQYFDGAINLEDSIDLIKKNSRHYAKRQYTWFKHQMKLKWFWVDFNNFDNTKQEVMNYLEKVIK
jgi:tRNA dimethylallyltransferase